MPVKNIIPGQKVTKEKQERARELRREMTPTEKVLWEELRGSKLGVRFRRQQVIQGFIVDFYCHRAGLVVEVDGDVHDLQKEQDERRERLIRDKIPVFRLFRAPYTSHGRTRGAGPPGTA